MSAEMLVRQFRINDQVWRMNLKDIGHAESLIDPRPAGNCINWVAGHLTFSRNLILGLLGREAIWTDETAKVYERGAAVLIPSDAMKLDGIRALWKQAQRDILSGLRETPADRLAAEAPAKAFGETVADNLAGLHFHETYHLGQLGLLRRLAGKEGSIT